MRRRLDAELVSRGLATSRGHAQELIAARRVTVGGAHALKASRQVSSGEPIVVSGPPPRFVGRAGWKLEGAFEQFALAADRKHCIDAGSSTGGFTDCMLQHGAASVVAVDVGTNQLHEKLRGRDRVIVMENRNIRSVSLADFEPDPERRDGFDLLVSDLSFTSTTAMLEHFATLVAPDGDLMVLVKPQFEAGRIEVSRGKGIISDPDVWISVLHEFIDRAFAIGLAVIDLGLSPIVGGKGNVEFLAHLQHAAHFTSSAPSVSGSDRKDDESQKYSDRAE